MAISREAKEKQLAELKDKLGESQLTVICDYRGLSVAEMQELRKLLGAEESGFKVIKKTLIRKALDEAKLVSKDTELDLDGQLGLAMGFGDEVTVAQVLARFAKEHAALELKAAINPDGSLLSAEEVQYLATLPGRDQLRAYLVGTIAGPIRGLVTVMSGNLRGLVNVLNRLSEQRAEAKA